MAANRCLLTSAGKEARDDLCELLYGGQRNYSYLEMITGLDRGETIPKIMGSKEGRIQGKKIEQFFDRVIGALREKYNREGVYNRQLAEKYLKPNLKIFNFWEEEIEEVATTSKRIKIKQQVAEALMRLDYSDQTKIFCDRLHTKQKHDVIALQVHGDDGIILQKLLVKRLSQFLKGGEPHLVVSMIVDRELRNGGIGTFWSKISPHFDSPESALPNDVIKAICNRCTTQPIVFVLYDFPKIGRHLDSLMDNFWCPLVEHLSGKFSNLLGKRLLLLLTGEQQSWLEIMPSMNDYSPCLLPKLDRIDSDHIDEWLLNTEVFQLRNRCMVENTSSSLETISDNWSDRTYGALDAMELICEACNFPGGLEQFKQYWQLSGDL